MLIVSDMASLPGLDVSCVLLSVTGVIGVLLELQAGLTTATNPTKVKLKVNAMTVLIENASSFALRSG
jgi:hypothetical protein